MMKIKPIDYKYCIPFYGNKHSRPYGWVLFKDEDGKTRKMYYELGQKRGKYEVINDGGTLHHPELMVTRV